MLACSEEQTDSSALLGNFDGVPAGAFREPYPDNPDLVRVTLKDGQGKITAQGEYYRGLRHGNWTEYHNNSLVSTITNYELGKKEGLALIIDQAGYLLERIYFHNDVKHGEHVVYNRSRIKEERFYQNDKIEGTVKVYYDNGKIMEESPYVNGQRHGMSRWYDQEGNISIEYEYDNGTLIKNE
ncbi:MAG: hypothetical protein OEX02_03045 [Cyclobacteriaceae bacterium]|nr:hypothetical protein [Cyclobacteriaceae bacterium]